MRSVFHGTVLLKAKITLPKCPAIGVRLPDTRRPPSIGDAKLLLSPGVAGEGMGASTLSLQRQEEKFCPTLVFICLEPARPKRPCVPDMDLDEHLQRGERASCAWIRDHAVE